jgi:hypothetical protein
MVYWLYADLGSELICFTNCFVCRNEYSIKTTRQVDHMRNTVAFQNSQDTCTVSKGGLGELERKRITECKAFKRSFSDSRTNIYLVINIVETSPSTARPYTSIANVMPPNDQSLKATSSKEMDDDGAEGSIHLEEGQIPPGSMAASTPSVLPYPDIPQYIPAGYAGGPLMPSRDPEDLASPPSLVRSVPLPQFGTVLQRAKSDQSPPPSLWERLSKVPITDL